MISVFTEHITPRLTYVLDFCFAQKGFEYQCVTDVSAWSKIKSIRINYSEIEVPSEISVKPHSLLFETEIRNGIELSTSGDKIFIDGKEDPFAVIFRCLSRYEEYLPNERDEHDRFKAKNAELVKLKLNDKPVCDILTREIWEKLGLDYSIIQKRFECVPSFDIDVAWAYKNLKLIRTIGAGIIGKNLGQRFRVLVGKEKDPYDTYSYIAEVSARVNRIICFAPVGDWGKFDKNIHWKNFAYQSLIRGLNATGGMGIHPSYDSHLNPEKLETEISRLEQIVGHEIVKSRQHFLRLRIPESYQLMVKQSIQRDFTMGWAEETGFRAGTSFPFTFLISLKMYRNFF
ncbi:MAG: hypothetical protein IPM77_16835 [Crocinitomicaceae bacterium]|nr:hypothetical protein [Crocinitomicaceae bacterium]